MSLFQAEQDDYEEQQSFDFNSEILCCPQLHRELLCHWVVLFMLFWYVKCCEIAQVIKDLTN